MSEETSTTHQEQHAFQTEIQQLLELMIHSLYTHEEIFLRELISNASDALNKVQFEQLTTSDMVSPDAELAIKIEVDRDANTLTLHDSGIGMSRDEMIENLGTIAHSGSKAFLQALKEAGKDQSDNLIGQFGVGFYSAFMVANKVEVSSRSFRPGDAPAKWASEGKGTYTLEDGDRTERGTTLTLHLKDEASKYLDITTLESIIKKYSDFVSFPIELDGKTANRQKALWQEDKKDVTDEAYHEFYGHLAHDTRKPLTHLHLSFEAPLQFNAILYVPPSDPESMWGDDRDKRRVSLYARRVFIQEDCKELLPAWLRFVVGVVDSADLPLNVSRETIQNNPLLGNIKNNLVRKLLGEFKSMAKREGDDYTNLWRAFSRYLKQGYVEDFGNRDKLVELLRFNTSHHSDGEGLSSLKEYVGRMREGQEHIYYANGESRENIERSPNLELLKKKGYEVLYMTDPIDALLMSWLNKYDDKDVKSVDDAQLTVDDEDTPDEAQSENVGDLIDFVKKTLGDRIHDARLSKRLVTSPVCLVNPEDAMATDMQRLYKMMDKDFQVTKKILELNPSAPLIQDLASMYDASRGNPTAQEGLRPWVEQLLDMALLAEGLHPDPASMVPRLQQVLTQAAGALAGAGGGALTDAADIADAADVIDVTAAESSDAEAKADG